MRLGKRSAKDREILRVDIDQAPIYLPITRHYSISQVMLFVQAKVFGSVHDKLVDFFKGPFIYKQCDSLSGGKLPFLVLSFNSCKPST